LDTTAFFAGALAAGFTTGFVTGLATALVAFAAGFAALGATFFAVAILKIFHFLTTKEYWPRRYSHMALTLANDLQLLALDRTHGVKFSKQISVFHLGYWTVFATKNARLHGAQIGWG
jgi:hypothetical protein